MTIVYNFVGLWDSQNPFWSEMLANLQEYHYKERNYSDMVEDS